jgi:hypothetical protein
MSGFSPYQRPWPMAAPQFDFEKFEDGGPSNSIVWCIPKDLQMNVQ